MKKKYEDIITERIQGKDTGLMVLPRVDENKLVPLISARNTQELVKAAQDFFPEFHVSTLAESNVAVGKEAKWLATVDEAFHAMETLPQIRTLTEKKLAVLQTNRHPTASARFHQSKTEQGVYVAQMLAVQKDIKIAKIKLEKMLYTYGKRRDALQTAQEANEDTFIQEKNLELYKIKVMDLISEIVGMHKRSEILGQEIMEWSDIKSDLYKEAQEAGEMWSPDEQDGEVGYQEVSLVLRHFQNFLMQIQAGEGSDISSILNIQGLCLTAFQSGMKSNKLGIYMKSLADEQIALLWKHLYGIDVTVQRNNEFMLVSSKDNQYVFPVSLELWQKMKDAPVI